MNSQQRKSKLFLIEFFCLLSSSKVPQGVRSGIDIAIFYLSRLSSIISADLTCMLSKKGGLLAGRTYLSNISGFVFVFAHDQKSSR
jgi:hypothetical protein